MKAKKPKPVRDVMPPPEVVLARGDHVLVGFREAGIRGLKRHYRFDRLHRYLTRNAITRAQYKAGRKFADDAELAQVNIPSLLDPRRGPGGQGPERRLVEVGARVADAMRRYQAAVHAMGIVNSRAVIAVCLTNTPADAWAETHRLHRDDGVVVLRAGLQSLVEHYGS